MILTIVSVFDVAIGAFNRPVFVPSRGAAMRGFSDEVNRVAPDNPVHVHPQDFQLFVLGTFDDASGKFFPLEVPERIASGWDLLNPGISGNGVKLPLS